MEFEVAPGEVVNQTLDQPTSDQVLASEIRDLHDHPKGDEAVPTYLGTLVLHVCDQGVFDFVYPELHKGALVGHC